MAYPLIENHTLADAANLSPLETAIWRTVAYVDVFDYALTAAEIHRYLEGMAATPAEVQTALAHGRLQPHCLSQVGDYYTLAGREETVAARQARAAAAAQLWPTAIAYGHLIANMPFVRMVAITGSLAMDNVEGRADIDYLLVTRNGRLWLSRAFTIAVVRLAARRGHWLCPNYILAERALNFPDQNLYTAHEVVQMIPLSGADVYQNIRCINAWADTFLPNAAGPPRDLINGRASRHYLRYLTELPLRTPPGRWLDRWEMRRKIRKFQDHNHAGEAAFSADWCKGHFDAHKRHALAQYETRVSGNR